MNFFFDEKINNLLKITAISAQEQGINLYLVGGVVRDNLLNIPLKDIDLIVDGNAIEFAKKLPNIIKVKSIHSDFATVKVNYLNTEVDIASTRTESYPYSGCLPVIDKIGVDIKKDYLRRDFTINAMYAKITFIDNDLHYKLIDYANGLNDIKNKALKVLHNKSYIDDPTRILRGVNFKYRFNFDFSLNDKELIKNYLKQPQTENASIDRIVSVFKKIVNHKNFKEIVKNDYYKIINNSELFVDFDLISKLNFNLDSEFYLKIILNKDVAKFKFNNDIEIIKEFSQFTESDLAYYFYKTKDENVNKYLKIKNIKLLTNGNDLIKMGFKEGKIIGIILDSLLKYKLLHLEQFQLKEDEINWVRKKYSSTNFNF